MTTENPDLLSPVTLAVGRLSDRALARLVGANAYLRGRVYARQQCVNALAVDGGAITAKVDGRGPEPYDVRVEITPDGAFNSACTCPAWRGADRHCKHVAAVMVALRDLVRPNRGGDNSLAHNAPGTNQALAQNAPGARSEAGGGHAARDPAGDEARRNNRRNRRNRGNEPNAPREVVVVDRSGPRVVSTALGTGTVQSAVGPGAGGPADRTNFAIWLPAGEPRRAPEYEYRVGIRAASMVVSIVNTESRQTVSPGDALEALGAHVSPHRPVLRVLNRLSPRGARGGHVEVRGDDAAEIVTLLRGRRVLLEPALAELRYLDEPLVPRLDLELVPPNAIRVRAVFERKGGDNRRFNLTQGLWLEGTPGWHVDPVQGVARPLADNVTSPWLERLARAPSITHPTADIGRLLGEIVPRVSLSLNAPLPDIQSIVDIEDATPTFILRASGDLVGMQATLAASYGEVELDIPPLELPPPLAIVPSDSPRPRCIRRDIGSERAAVDRLLELGVSVSDDGKLFVASGDQAIAFWTEGIGTLPDDWDRFIPDNLVDVIVRETPVAPRARVSSGVDWLSLDVDFSSEGSRVSEEDVRRALAGGHRLVKLDDGTYAPIVSAQISDVLTRMAEIFAQGRKKLPLSQAGRIQDLLRSLEATAPSVTNSARDFFDRLGDRAKVPVIALPKGVRAEMRPYQHEGFSWLVFLQKMATGGILADDMGLGKTLQAIAMLQWVHEQKKGAPPEPVVTADEEVTAKKTVVKKTVAKKGKVAAAAKEAAIVVEEEPKTAAKAKKGAAATTKLKKGAKVSATMSIVPPAPVEEAVVEQVFTMGEFSGPLALVIAPTSVVPNWVREIEKFAPGLRAMAWTGSDREKYRAALASADVVVTSYALLRRDEEILKELDVGYVILDEAQHIKNPLSATARAARALRGQRRLALTGTPIENRLSEIWSIFEFVSPGLLGALAQFEERYARPIDRGDPEAARRLRAAIHPFVLRRVKSEVAKDLPEKIVSERLCEMSPEQTVVYKTVLRSVRESVLGEVERLGIAKSQLQILAGLTRLRQAACDPRLLKLPNEFADDAGKLVALRELLSEAGQSGHRTLVFSQFVEMLKLIRVALDTDKIAYEYIDGSTEDRQSRVDRFNRDENIPVFLISLKAGGTGLNLTGADTVVHFDPWWNPAVEDQATDRAHRIGQTKVVTAYRLVARGTIEEKILSLSAKKRELVANVLGREDEVGTRGLSRADVESLLSEE